MRNRNLNIRTYVSKIHFNLFQSNTCIMQRIYNQMTSTRRRKAMGGRGGIKMGDFGSGGRVYSTDYVRPAGSGSGAQCNPSKFGVASCLCTVVPLLVLVVTERSLFRTAGCIAEAGENAVPCESPFVLDQNEGALIFVATRKTKRAWRLERAAYELRRSGGLE